MDSLTASQLDTTARLFGQAPQDNLIKQAGQGKLQPSKAPVTLSAESRSKLLDDPTRESIMYGHELTRQLLDTCLSGNLYTTILKREASRMEFTTHFDSGLKLSEKPNLLENVKHSLATKVIQPLSSTLSTREIKCPPEMNQYLTSPLLNM